MPSRKRKTPGQYKEKPAFTDLPNFTGKKPLTIFQGENGKWGAKDAEGNIELSTVYELLPQTEEDKAANRHRLANEEEVLAVTPDDWDVIFWRSLD